MHIDLSGILGMLALSAPLPIIVALLAAYPLRRVAWKLCKRFGKKRLGYYPTTFALGMAMQFMQVYHRPSVAYVLEVKQEQQVEEDDEGGPESLIKQLGRQLQRIRRGDPIERLVLRI